MESELLAFLCGVGLTTIVGFLLVALSEADRPHDGGIF